MAKSSGETVRSLAKREFAEHPVSSLAFLAVSGAGVSLATHYMEEAYHAGKDYLHSLRERRHEEVDSETTERAEHVEESCDA